MDIGMRLFWYGIIFLLGVIFHIFIVTLVKKCVFSDAFSQLPKMEKFLHILHTIAFPEASVDWDYGNTGTLETYRRQWEAFKKENIFMVVLHTVENLLMAVPVFFICSNVVSYHITLPYTTDREKEAYNTARYLRIVWPVIVLLLPILQGLLLLAYNKYGHPWKIIFAKFGDTVTYRNMATHTENTEIRELAEDEEPMVEEVEASEEVIDHIEENIENGELAEDPKAMAVAMKHFSDIEVSFAPAETESISEV